MENLKNMLYKKTRLEDTFGVNMLAVANGRPETLGLKAIIEHHVDFQFELTTRKYKTLLAKELDADVLIILTAIEKAAIHFGTPEQTWLDDITVAEAKQYIAEGHFAPGSMLPKMQAAVEFAESAPGRQSLITLLEKAREGIQGLTGTRIHLE